MMGGEPPFFMIIEQDDGVVFVKKYSVTEYGDDQITREEINLDGSEMKSTMMMNSERVSTASLNEEEKNIVYWPSQKRTLPRPALSLRTIYKLSRTK